MGITPIRRETPGSDALSQGKASLEEQVRVRTRELEKALAENERINRDLLRTQEQLQGMMRALESDIARRVSAEEAVRESEQRFRLLFENMLEGFAYCRVHFEDGEARDFQYLAVNEAFSTLTGLSGVTGRWVSDILPGLRSAEPALFELYGRVAAGGAPEKIEIWIESMGIWFSISVYNSGRNHFVAIFDNITARKRHEADLGLAASVFHNTMEGVMVTDTRSRILSVNPAFTEITGYTAEEAVGETPALLRSDRHDGAFYRALWSQLAREGRWEGEIWNRRKNGEAYLEWLTISAVNDIDGRAMRYVGVFNDITELRRKDEHIRHLAFHDALTGLPNRALLLDRLEHGIIHARRDGTRFAIMFIDLDRFKAINDTLGHDVGDALLQEVAVRLVRTVRKSDTVARMGGDEFLIYLEDADEVGVYGALARKLLDALSLPVTVAGHTMHVGASIGIACFPEDGASAVDLMKNADAAMYVAKASGRGMSCFFQPAMTEKATQRLRLEMDLRQAVDEGALELFYQPKVSLADRCLCGFEALVRWRHPTFGMVPPVEFIPLAEETGLIGKMGLWVLENTCAQVRAWRDQGLAVPRIAVNISAKQLQEGDLAEIILGLCERHGITPDCLEIELTESVVMADPERSIGIFSRLRQIGATIAMDDFGTGYSSLAYLRRLPLDVLKIDRSFVLAADQDEGDAQIVRTVLALGQALKLSVVAEGVETERHASFLRDAGCSVGQGYLYARPAPAREIESWLRH